MTKQIEDFAKWYSDICHKAELIVHSPIKGNVIFEPYAYKIWELIQENLNFEFRKLNIQNLMFPTLIPMSFFKKEKEHVKGFSPELAIVTNIGGKILNDQWVLRPTSETMFAYYFSIKLKTYKQLPILLNQWCSVIRQEKNTKPFLRTSEFLWQEGHTCHLKKEEAIDFAKKIWNIYNNFINKKLQMSTFFGEKTEKEKFSGAKKTFTIEILMKDGQALQSCTSHYLGRNFSKTFNISYVDKSNNKQNPYQTSWGISTRIIGGLIMNHGDDKGLVLPLSVAPYQIVLLEIMSQKNPKVSKVSKNLFESLQKKYRVFLDDSDKGFGYKTIEWEQKGVPFRIEIGPKDLANDEVVIVDRITSKKCNIKLENISLYLEEQFRKYESLLYKKSKGHLLSNTVNAISLKDLESKIKEKKLVKVYMKIDSKIEQTIKNKTSATIRCYKEVSEIGKCFITKQSVNTIAYIARAY